MKKKTVTISLLTLGFFVGFLGGCLFVCLLLFGFLTFVLLCFTLLFVFWSFLWGGWGVFLFRFFFLFLFFVYEGQGFLFFYDNYSDDLLVPLNWDFYDGYLNCFSPDQLQCGANSAFPFEYNFDHFLSFIDSYIPIYLFAYLICVCMNKILRYVNLRGLFNAKAILVDKQQWY